MNYRKSTFHVLQNKRAGLSLIEVLIGLTVTLIVLGAMAGAFRFASEEMAKGRASLELTNRLRTVENLFRDDLRRLTVELKPYHRLPATPEGYVEIIDGPVIDARNIADDGTTPARNESAANLLLGDFDDIFAGTIRSDGSRPFRGRFGAGIEQSHLAEVVWFTTFSDTDGDGNIEPDEGDRIRLFRRQLIVKPSLGVLGTFATIPLANQFIQNNDISCNVTPVGGNFVVQANSLQDLTRRGNRYGHVRAAYPQMSVMNPALLRMDDQYEDENQAARVFPHRRASDQSDLLLNDVAAFDIRVFAPDAVSLVRLDTGLPPGLQPIIDMALPADLGSQIAIQTAAGEDFNGQLFYDADGNSFQDEQDVLPVNRVGAYVDLGKVGGGGVLHVTPTNTPAAGGRPALNYTEAVYDTGTSAYDTSTLFDALPVGSNGIDDDGDGIIDSDEKLLPPYDVRIRGIELTVRLYEPNASQATQMTLRQSMVPE